MQKETWYQYVTKHQEFFFFGKGAKDFEDIVIKWNPEKLYLLQIVLTLHLYIHINNSRHSEQQSLFATIVKCEESLRPM